MKKLPPTRAPLSDEELRFITTDQFFQLKLTVEEKTRLKEINLLKEQERKERASRLRVEEEPMLAELRQIGQFVESVWDLVNVRDGYPEAIPILLKHLVRPYSDVIREGIARSLAIPEPAVKKAWPVLQKEYLSAPAGFGLKAFGDTREYQLGAKDGLACALAASVTEETMPDLLALVKDRANGQSRLLLLSALKRRRNKSQLVAAAIQELTDDPDLRKEIASWAKR